jgi:predicted nucleotidyltransferase
MDTFETVRNDNRLLYEYIRGSHLYGLNNEDSDVDTSGLFLAPKENFFGLEMNYQPLISDERHDTTWFELGNFCQLLLKSNPTVLEALFVPNDKIITAPSEIVRPILENRDQFVSKQCFKPFISFAVEQIHKARGLNKKIVNPVTERLTPFDFAYTFYNQGSTKIRNWLENRGLNKDFCGLVHIPNMHDTYGVYYDWGAHFEADGIKSWRELYDKEPLVFDFIHSFYKLPQVCSDFEDVFVDWFNKHKEILHYRGMCLENSTDMRGSSVSKGERPLCWMVYNESGFKDHCKKYKEYKDWEKFRNPKRYESNLEKNYDSKNMMHCMRLIHMGQEIAEGRGIILQRTDDKEFLMNIRNHKYEYDELMEKIDADKEALDRAIANSTIKETIDVDFVNDLLIEMRKKAYGVL